jgi:hypothetical protein
MIGGWDMVRRGSSLELKKVDKTKPTYHLRYLMFIFTPKELLSVDGPSHMNFFITSLS